MILSIHQSLYLAGPLSLWNKIANSDLFISLDGVPISRSDYVHRNNILQFSTANFPIEKQRIIRLTHGLGKHKNQPLIKDVFCDSGRLTKHLKTIELNYKKAKYYEPYKDLLRYFDIITNLSTLNYNTMKLVAKELDLKTDFSLQACYETKGTGSDLILSLCKQAEADTYLSGPFGREYLDLESFDKAGIKVKFQEFEHPKPNTCVLDWIFREGIEKTKERIKNGIWQ